MRDSVENRRCPLQRNPPPAPARVTEEAGRRQRKGLAQSLGLGPPAIPAANLYV